MAKGNAFLGQLRGKIGDVVFTRTGGAQTSRALNRHPRNPQTPAQMYQRGCLATVSEMYIRGTRNFFKYAFMNKTAAQSEFNKFCQLNIGRVPCNSKAALAQGAPAIGNFIMTQGTLQQIHIDVRGDSFTLTMRNNISSKPVGEWTMGDVAKAFIETYGYQQGDIITYLDISSPATPFSTINDMITNEALTSVAGTSLWNIKQFRLDTTSTALMADSDIFQLTSSDNVLVLVTTYNMNAVAVEGITMVCSRNVKSGVLVSTSEMLCNTATQRAIDLGKSDAWKEAVARYWVPDSASEINPVNILQGSLSVDEPTTPPDVEVTTDYPLPIICAELNGKHAIFSRPVTALEIAEHLKIKSSWGDNLLDVEYVKAFEVGFVYGRSDTVISFNREGQGWGAAAQWTLVGNEDFTDVTIDSFEWV